MNIIAPQYFEVVVWYNTNTVVQDIVNTTFVIQN